MKRTLGSAALLALVASAACEPASTDTLVARAGDYEFTVATAVEILAPRTELPNQPQVVASLADLWIDYTLLADAALDDTTFSQVNVSELVEQQAQGEMILALQDSMIRPDTAVTAEELQALFRQEAPGIRVRARHILLGIPPQASQAQRDSVRAELEGILARARGGEDFATLAQTYSQDRGSGARGGDLGEFGPGEMVRPFEQAAFALEPGEISDVVESPYGFHIIKVEDKTVPTFDEGAEDFRFQVQARRYQEAESAYVAGLREAADPQVVEGAGQLVKDLSQDVAGELTPRARSRALVRFEGGTVTVGDLMTFLEARPEVIQVILNSSPDVIEEELLLGLAQRQIFIRAARDAGLDRDQAFRDSLSAEIRGALGQASQAVGVRGILVPEGMTREEAVQATVLQLLRGIVAGSREVVPLGPLGVALRTDTRVELFEAGVVDAVNRITEIRGPATQPQPAAAPDTAGAGAAPDTAGGA
ncbi:MAG TPA: peptidylprolyl isomerase [Longimicrobiales bacterium]|nr:peptidylprolyl isomerase [Longimicrobiales bacterium]